MKTVYLILTIVFLCSSNSVFAQFHQTTYDWQAKMQRKINYPFYDGPKDNKSIKKKKPRIHYTVLSVVEKTTDEATGLTTLRWADGSSYVGLTDRGAMFVGTMTYADGSKYIGKWERNLPNGKGTFINPEGVAFTGKFKDGIPHGKCVMQDIDGRLYSARWVRGVLKEKSIKPLEEKK